jgi:hypothetical protein
MNATQRQNATDGDTAVAEPRSDAEKLSSDAATTDAPAVDSMDRDDWLCRVGDVARRLREQRRATAAAGRQTAEDRG